MKQITIVTENPPGLLAKITKILGDENINIESIDAQSSATMGTIILTVDQYDKALQIFSQMDDIKALTEDVILLKMEDKPGALARIAKRFQDAQLNVRSIRIIQRGDQQSYVAVCADDNEAAKKLVEDLLVT